MEKFTLNDLPKLTSVQSIKENSTLREALSFLIKHNIYTVPVLSDDGNFKGIVSLDSIIGVIVKLFADKSESNQDSLSGKITHYSYDKKATSEITHTFDEKTLKTSDVISVCNIVDPNTKLIDAIHLILDKKQRLVIGTEKNITNIISPFLLVKFLSLHKDLPLFSQQLKDTKAKITSPIQSIESNKSAINAYAKMVEGGFSGLGVIEEGKIITVLTFKDIGLASSDFSHLLEPTEEYVKNVRQSRIDTTTYPTINVSETDTLSTVVQKFVAVKSHRIFVRRGESIYGIVSVSDLLNAFI